MATIQIADKPTLDSVNTTANTINTETTYIKNKVDNISTTLTGLSIVKSIQRGSATKNYSTNLYESNIATVNPDKCIVLIDGSAGAYYSGNTTSYGYTALPTLSSITANKLTFSFSSEAERGFSVSWQLIEFY